MKNEIRMKNRIFKKREDIFVLYQMQVSLKYILWQWRQNLTITLDCEMTNLIKKSEAFASMSFMRKEENVR
jgi:hypothetical protein